MRQIGFSPVRMGLFLGLFLLCVIHNPATADESPLTIREVAKDLACPCQCPLILQDCNMSCGLRWKEEIGQEIAKGKTKQEITEYFIAKYGEGARLTPLQKVQGKTYQYTRGFGTMEWVIFGSGVAIWLGLGFFMVHFIVKKFLRRKKAV